MLIERLSREDRFMLWPDRLWPQVNGALLLLEPDGQLSIDSLREAVASRLHLVPRFRQLLYVPPRRLGGPLWIDADAFDLTEHVRERRVPSPAHERELLATVEDLWCRRLDHSRPLWEMWLLTGLPQDRSAVFIKMHHVIADGVAAIATLAAFLDTAPDARHSAPPPWTPGSRPAPRDLFLDGMLRRGLGVGRAFAPVVHPARTARAIRAASPALREILADEPLPPTSLAAIVGSGHELAAIRTSLSLIKAIGHDHGAKVNDVFLALITGGLRELMRTRGELSPGMVLRIGVPVSLRLSERAQARGNLISEMVVPLPVGYPDPVNRLRRIAAETARRRKLSRPSLAVLPINRLLGPVMLKLIARQRVNVASTNVPGPEQTLYLAGARILEVFPLLPLIGDQPLAIGALSYAGQFTIMAVGDRRLVPDLEVFADGMRGELAAFSRHSAREDAVVRDRVSVLGLPTA
jgi:diacylglycerol O-acyltransferase / wax synthase